MTQDFRNQFIDKYKIFNEPEILFHSLHIEPTIHILMSYRSKAYNTPNLLPFEDIYYTLDSPSLSCSLCKSLMVKIRKETVYSEIDFIPGQLTARNHVRNIYSCTNCQKTGSSITKKSLIPSPALKKSLVSLSTITYLIKSKYIDAISFKDIEDNYLRHLIPVNRHIMSNWIIEFTRLYIIPFYELLKGELTKANKILYSNVKPRILKNENKLFLSKVIVWAYETDTDEKNSIILYTYSTNRGGYPPAKFLKAFTGILREHTSPVPESLYSFIPDNNQWVLADNFHKDSVENKYSFAIYSLIATAIANKVDPYAYLVYLLNKLPGVNFKKEQETAKRFFPWLCNELK